MAVILALCSLVEDDFRGVVDAVGQVGFLVTLQHVSINVLMVLTFSAVAMELREKAGLSFVL